jgi:hypothetical protein
MAWVVPMLPSWYFCDERALTNVQVNTHYCIDAVHRFPQWCKSWTKNWILKCIFLWVIVTMVWMVLMVPFWLFYYECPLHCVQANAHNFTDTAHGFPQWRNVWAKKWILKPILFLSGIVTMAWVVPMVTSRLFSNSIESSLTYFEVSKKIRHDARSAPFMWSSYILSTC